MTSAETARRYFALRQAPSKARRLTTDRFRFWRAALPVLGANLRAVAMASRLGWRPS